MEYSIQQVAKAMGTTSRTLRHYDSIGLVSPSRVGHGGHRIYDNASLVRLQQVLLLRQLGLGLATIKEALRSEDDGVEAQITALSQHLDFLFREQDRLEKQVESVKRTIATLSGEGGKLEGVNLLSKQIFDGFDHAAHRAEVQERWGASSYEKGDRWWNSLGNEAKYTWKQQTAALSRDWLDASGSETPDSPVAQDLAARHVQWLRAIPGTPAHEPGGDLAGYVLGLAQMYVSDERFAANYGGVEGATFVAESLRHYVRAQLS